MVAPRAPVEVRIHELPRVVLKQSQVIPRVSSSGSINGIDGKHFLNVGSVPEIDDLPLLDNESCIGFELPSREPEIVKPKPRRSRPVKFVNCTISHPMEIYLHTKDRKPQLLKKPTQSYISSFYTLLSQSKRIDKIPPQDEIEHCIAPNNTIHSTVEQELAELNINDDMTEMVEYGRKEVSLFIRPVRPFLRSSESYLRIFVADKQMYRNGKVNRIRRSQYEYPRKDEFTNSPVQLLGISYKWRKLPPRRRWTQLN